MVATEMSNTINFTHLLGKLNFYTFQHDSAPAHIACKMVQFLDCNTPDFMPQCCLVLIR